MPNRDGTGPDGKSGCGTKNGFIKFRKNKPRQRWQYRLNTQN